MPLMKRSEDSKSTKRETLSVTVADQFGHQLTAHLLPNDVLGGFPRFQRALLRDAGIRFVNAAFERAPGKRKRSGWTYAPLALADLDGAEKRARERLKNNPAFIEQQERLGRERALIYKTLVLTGLRKGELASLTAGRLNLAAEQPYALLDAADEKNRQGSTIPLRGDLAADLASWLEEKRRLSSGPVRGSSGAKVLKMTVGDSRPPSAEKVFEVPEKLVAILDRDLKLAGIAKRDELGRTVDVHALRHSFCTLMSVGGVTPRTAQAAMRHSNINLTMTTYTDPRLLDVHGAMDLLPSLPLNAAAGGYREHAQATGTDGRFAPGFAPAPDHSSPLLSSTVHEAVILAADGDGSEVGATPMPINTNGSTERTSVEPGEGWLRGLEPPTLRSTI